MLAARVALVWLVGMTNAFNLLDNMDGLAATLAAIAAAFFAIDAARRCTRATSSSRSSLALALACVGLPPVQPAPRQVGARSSWATPAARCSASLLAALGLTASWKVAGTTVATLLLPILILAVPILDTALVTVVRLLEGRPIYQGGRDHTSHRLVYHGLSEKRAVVLLASSRAALGATSLAYSVLDNARVTADRRAPHVRPARPVRELPRATSSGSPGRVSRPRLAAHVRRAPAPARRGRSSTSR